MATLPQVVSQESLVEEAVNTVAFPKGVRLRRIQFDVDHTGDPAIYIYFGTSRRLGIGNARIHSLVAFKQAVRDAVYSLGLNSFPYIRFEDAR